MQKVKKEVNKEKLLACFIAEAYFLDHWLIQIGLSSDVPSIIKRMGKRLAWVNKQIKKLENEKQ